MTPLHELFLKHGSDKAWHGYARHYEPLFMRMREDAGKMLELGIAGGASLRAWHEYFPHFIIHGVDHTQACVDPMREFDARTVAQCGDVTYDEFWKKFISNWTPDLNDQQRFDIVIDDASHNVWAQAQAFLCGWPILKPGGYWSIEDTHASFDPAYRRDNERNGMPEAVTIMDVIFRESGRRLHEFGDSQCGRFTTVESDIESVTYTKSLIILRKRSTQGAEQ